MPPARGRTLSLSPPRRVIGDLVHFAHRIPTVPVERRMRLAGVRAARERAGRVSWCALFVKAFALVAERAPALRRAHLRWPWRRLYEHPFSVCSVAVERDYQGEPGVFFCHLRAPENQSLAAIDDYLRRVKSCPVEELGLFRRYLKIGRLPTFLRRLLWWLSLEWSGAKRAQRLGTFGVSVYAGAGAASLHPLSPLTCTLTYGVLDQAGSLDVRLIYDHRTLDGATVARALAAMETVLCNEIVAELGTLAATRHKPLPLSA